MFAAVVASTAAAFLLAFVFGFLRMAGRTLVRTGAGRVAGAVCRAQLFFERLVVKHQFAHVDFGLIRFDVNVDRFLRTTFGGHHRRLVRGVLLLFLRFALMRSLDRRL